MAYYWIYTTSNENSYILFLIIVILCVIIVNFNLWKKKTDKFNDVANITTPQNIVNEMLNLTPEQIAKRNYLMGISNSNPGSIEPSTTQYNLDNQSTATLTHATEAQIDRASLSYGISNLDGDQETIITPNNTKYSNNDIMQSNSSLYTSILTGKSTFQSTNYATIGNYATLDSLGSTMTDTLGGIKSNLGYAILDDQLGTFTPKQQNNPYAYDNTANYQTGMNPATVNGSSSCSGSGGSPIFLQKDFTGVANIFAPNIIIANPPLTSDGLPDISYKM
jgi:hypothetical protein